MWAIQSALSMGILIYVAVFTITLSSTKDVQRAITAGIIGYMVMFTWEW